MFFGVFRVAWTPALVCWRQRGGDLCPISPGKLGWARPTDWPLGPFRNSPSPKPPCEEALKLLDVELAKPTAAVVHTNAGARKSWTPGPGQEGAPDTRPDGKKRRILYSVPFSTSTPLLDQVHHHDRSSFFLFRPARHPVCDAAENRALQRARDRIRQLPALDHHLSFSTLQPATKLLTAPFCAIHFVTLVDTTPSVLPRPSSFPTPQQS